ncbi:alpha-D-ribose 1-methylphosphonate 5-triphosphate diphosphatase [Marinivivus vitaminiproducens]|uniref:alpha-D-ribose 1-methylphosphonate 5-triphosphate diphosphatase n=1 Tax=Marinivivus vitaminiproducens TaxID=3035935 RepID=UPI00279BBBC4|nr:alpha-D-ribose 1-methylphosphonate 5-triphosphate diphosphatase [Geminicoccaceae bacterium SCSIO 64248]
MSADLALTNARVVTPEGVLHGHVEVSKGRIAAVAPGPSRSSVAIDMDGDYVLPGLVELHTDNLERAFSPRPGVRWPAEAAMIAHDAQIASAGITTVCDAICVGSHGGKQERRDFLETSVRLVRESAERGVLRAEHRIHLRCELADPHVVEMFEPLSAEPGLVLVSFMDHTPGQRQWHDLDKYRLFHFGRTVHDEAAFQAMVEQRKADQTSYSDPHRRRILALLEGRSVARASHDDTTLEHVAEAVVDGITIAEFPTTLTAAQAARQAGLSIVMGAPNIILGGSHSGNVSALALAADGLLDGLSSDYVPVSLLHAAFRLCDELDLPLEKAIEPITARPAAMIGLSDRGSIEVGLKGDLIRVRRRDATPAVLAAWRQGERIV